jgi:hypothetical protein
VDILLEVFRSAVGEMVREGVGLRTRAVDAPERGGAGEEDIGDRAGGIEGGGIMRRFAVTFGNAVATCRCCCCLTVEHE